MLRIAIQTKGRLHEDTMSLLAESGIKLEASKRLLLVPARNFPIEVLFLRDDDIPQAVADGTADVGVVGENECLEKKQNIEIISRLGFSKCRLSIAIPKHIDYQGVEWLQNKVIATSYPKILADFLKDKKVESNIHIITGSVEIAPGIGLADAIFDIVSSGNTLITNNLKEVELVAESEALLISNPNLSEIKKNILNDFLFRIEAVLRAEDKKYVLMNIPNENLKNIVEILPGMKSPTIMPLAKEGWSSLHVVLSEKRFWDVISKLKKLGAESILVMPIEKMIL